MKKNNLLLSIFAIMFFVSCSDIEPLDSTLLAGNSTNNSSGGNSGGSGGSSGGSGSGSGSGSGGGTTAGDYWPASIGNWWQFEQDGDVLDPMEMVGTDVFSGATYYRFEPQSGSGNTVFGTATSWLNKNNGIYKLKMDDITISAGSLSGVQTGYEFIVLKDNIAVNSTWTGSYTQTTTYTGIPAISQTTNYTGTILAKDVTEVVDGESYPNVIKVEIEQETIVTGAPSMIVTTEYWFARDIGPIKAVSETTGSTNTSILIGYAVN